MADDFNPAYVAIKSPRNLPAGAPVAASGEALSLAQQPKVEILPAELRHGRIWPVVGAALVWAARELLPEILAAWRTPRVGELQPTGRNSMTSGLAAFTHRRTGHRHRWGRA